MWTAVAPQVGGRAVFALRPARSGIGRAASGSGAVSNTATGTDNAPAIASSVVMVTFSEPRSTRPT